MRPVIAKVRVKNFPGLAESEFNRLGLFTLNCHDDVRFQIFILTSQTYQFILYIRSLKNLKHSVSWVTSQGDIKFTAAYGSPSNCSEKAEHLNKMFSCKTSLLSTHLVVQRQFKTVHKNVN